MKQEINPVFLGIGLVLALGVIIFVFVKASSPPTPPAGSYTPGVPPWLEKKANQGQPGQQGQEGVHMAPTAPGTR